MGKFSTKKTVITLIALAIGGLHFVTGESYQGQYPVFVNGYLIDILLPMALYLLMGLSPTGWIRSTLFRAMAVLLFGCVVESSQYFGYPLLGSTFDPLDILAYGAGVGLGVLLDPVIFPRCIPHWNDES